MAPNLPSLDMSKFGTEQKPSALPSLDMTHFASQPNAAVQPSVKPSEIAQPQSSSLLRRLGGDVGISALKGAIGLPEAIVGLADIPTLGYAGKLAETAGFRPKEARAVLDEYLSPEQTAANKAVSEAKGFLPTVSAAVQNPSTIAHSVIESLPVMGGGGVIARGLKKSVESLSPYVAGAIGEGAVSGGLAAEQVRQQTDEGTLTPGQAAASFASGAGTAAFGAAGGRLAKKLGVTDIDTLLAGGKLVNKDGTAITSKAVARRIIEGGITEGAFEELPQSVQEQIWQNAALGKPLLEGAPESGAMGLLAGGVMGGIAGGLTGGKTGQVQPDQGTPFPPAAPPAGPESPITRAAQAGGLSVPGIESADLGPIEEITLQSRPGPFDAELAALEQSQVQPPSTAGLEATALTPQESSLEGGVSPARQSYLDSLVPITEDITVQGGVSPERAATIAQPPDLRALPAPAPRLPAPNPLTDQLDRLREATNDALLGPISRAARAAPAQVAPVTATKTPQETPSVAVATPQTAQPRAAPGQTEAQAGKPPKAPETGRVLSLPMAKLRAAQLTKATGIPHQVEAHPTEQGKFTVIAGESVPVSRETKPVEKPPGSTLSPDSLQDTVSPESVSAPAVTKQSEQAEPAQTVTSTTQEAPKIKEAPVMDMQNRDRDRAASIQQMQSIANDPDADRLSVSPTPDTGAPMVHPTGQVSVPNEDIGKDSRVTMADGSKIPVRYAVVEADSVLASHNADGTPNKAYNEPGQNTLKALNNGRTAGVQGAYRRGKADKYRQGISDLTEEHGVSPEAIAAKKSPMIIRLYDESENRKDMGRLSNTSQGLGFSATETALNDARAIDMSRFNPGENGELLTAGNSAFLKEFVSQIPASERAGMMDKQGAYTKQLIDRVQAAIFAKAYKDTDLISLFSETADTEIKNVMQALTIAAPEFAKIGEAGNLDIRPYLVNAVKFIRAAKAVGRTIEQELNQGTLLARDSLVDSVAEFMGKNIRSPKRMGEALAEAARFIQNEVDHAANEDMFGGRGTDLSGVIGRINSYLTENYGDEAKTLQTSLFETAEAEVPGSTIEPRDSGGQSTESRGTETETPEVIPVTTTPAAEATGPTPPQGGVSASAVPFNSEAWNKERDERIRESKAAGNKHLDQVTPSVETMRGKTIYYAHNPQQRG
ncbi:MAG: hypothetical protein NUV75_01755, partial [Gallionella sp.]|nr:hypothetical protein [Gallionella sp.]